MFDWHSFFSALIAFSVVFLIAGLITLGLYLMYELGNVWGFALIAGAIALGGSIAIGFGL